MDVASKIPVTLPLPNPTTSYWQDPPSAISNHRSTDGLPGSPDYVIVGSGISGASIAYHLLAHDPTTSILMLEARETCSGATGRNGGHTKAASYRSFAQHERDHGTGEAVAIAKLEHANIRATYALAAELGIECAALACDTVDVVYDAAAWEQGNAAIRRMRETMGSHAAARYEVVCAEEARARFLTPGALGAFVYEAGSLSAYAFAVGLVQWCLRRGMNLQTNTPVEKIEKVGEGEGEGEERWKVWTQRGVVKTPRLVLATNGYTARLLPEMQELIVPLRGQITAQRPGAKMPQTGLDTTYSFIYGQGYEYMIARPPGTKDEGMIVIGGGLGMLPHDGASEFGNTRDAELNPDISTYLHDCTERYFGSNWGQDHHEGRVAREWSGIMGTSADGLPYVGEMPGMPGLFISASFNGHGMVLCLKCAEALVDVMVGGDRRDRLDEWFPKALTIAKERFEEKFEGRLNMRVPGEAVFDKAEGKQLRSL